MRKSIILLASLFTLYLNGQNMPGNTWLDQMHDPEVNFYDVVDSFNDYWDGKAIEKGRGWKQFRRWEAFMEPRVFPTGNRYGSSNLFNSYNGSESSSSILTASGLGDWSLVGPSNGNSLNGIGRVNVIALHPNQNNIIFAGSPAGGLWKSINDGLSWSTNTDLLPNLGVSAILIDPKNTNIMYIGTGDRDGGDTYSIGVLKSFDGGQTWDPTALSFNVTQSYRITGLVMHHDSSNHIVAASRTGIYQSTDGGLSWSLKQGGSFQCIVKVPGSNKLFAGTSSNGQIWVSFDFGTSWSKITNGLPTGAGRVELAVTANDTSYAYAIYGANNNGLYGVYRTIDGGASWAQRHGSTPNLLDWSTNGSGSGGQAWYDLSIAVSPLNKNVVLTGGVNVWRSNNGGSSFSLSGHWYGGGGVSFVHADHHWMIFRPGSDQVYAGCDGGVYKSGNGGMNNSWVSRNQGLAITQYYKIGTSESAPALTIAGAQDNGTHLNDNGWDRVGGGDGMDCAIALGNSNTMYRSIYYGDFDKSTNGGNNFNATFNLPPSGSGNWVTPFIASRISSNILYAGFDRLWKSTNGGINFNATTSSGIFGSNNIDVIAEAPGDPNTLYAGINNRLYYSSNAGLNWTWISSNIGSGNVITGITVDPLNSSHVYISKSGYISGAKVYESFNAGSSWYNRSGSIPNIPANCIQYQKNSNGIIYIGTDLGVYFRDASMSDWLPFNNGIPNTIVNDIEILDNVGIIRVGTYGRGVWESPLANSFLIRPEADFTASPENTCSIGDTIIITDNSKNLASFWNWTITPATFQYINGTGTSSSQIEIRLQSKGPYTVKLISGNSYGSDTIVRVNTISAGGIETPTFEEFFQAIPNRWSISNPDYSNGWSIAPFGSTTDSSCAVFKGYNYSNTGELDDLISPNYSLDSNSLLIYDLAYRQKIGSNSDTLNVYVSDNCGVSWNLLQSFYNDINNSFSTGPSQSISFTPSNSSDWRSDTIALQGYHGNLKFKFEIKNANGNNLYLDRIQFIPDSFSSPIANIFSDTIACINNPIKFYSTGKGKNSTYLWTFPGGSPNSSSLINPTVRYLTPGSKSISLNVSNSSGNDSVSLSNSLDVLNSSQPSISISSNMNSICSGDTMIINTSAINIGNSARYFWTINSTPYGGNSSSIQLFNLNNGDTVRCEVLSSEICASPSKTTSNSIITTILPLPLVQAGSYTPVCAGSAAVNLQGTPSGGVFSGTGVVNGSFLPTAVGQGQYTVTYTYSNNNGCVNTAESIITVTGGPNVFITLPASVLCKNDPAFNVSGGYPSGGNYYINGILSTQIEPNNLGVGKHELKYIYTNFNGCTASRIDSFEIKNTPPIPSVQIFNGDSLFCPEAILGWNIQWLDVNKTAISGATKPWFIAPFGGVYYARLKLGNSCFPTSSAANIISIEELKFSKLTVTPNPSSDLIEIISFGKVSSSYTIKLTNSAGQILKEYNKKSSGDQDIVKLNISSWPPGVYLIERIDSEKIESERLIKL